MNPPKFKIDQKIWCIDSTKAVEKIITTVRRAKGGIVYYGFGEVDRFKQTYSSHHEGELFETKEELLKSL